MSPPTDATTVVHPLAERRCKRSKVDPPLGPDVTHERMRWILLVILAVSATVACADGDSTPSSAFPIEAERTCAPVADACSAKVATSAGVAASSPYRAAGAGIAH